jgi:hypothetical protein
VGLLILRARLVPSRDSPCLLSQQLLCARQLQSAQGFRSLAPLKGGLRQLDLRLKRSLFDAVQRGSLCD